MSAKKKFHYVVAQTREDGCCRPALKESIKSDASKVLLQRNYINEEMISGPFQTKQEARDALKEWEKENISQCARCDTSCRETSLDWDGFCLSCAKKVRCRVCEKYVDDSEVLGWICDECFEAAEDLRREPSKPHWTNEYIDWNDKSIPLGKRKVVFVKWLMKVKKLQLDEAKRVCHRKFGK